MPAPSDRSREEDLALAVADLRVASGDRLVIRAEGLSMGPLLATPRQVLLAPPSRWRPGQVLAARTPDGLVIHRLLRTTGSGPDLRLHLKGDNRFVYDEPVSPDQVLGQALGFLEGDRLRRPWSWRGPLSRLCAGLSRCEAALWPHFNYPLRVVHRGWRWRWRRRYLPSKENRP